MSQEQAELKSTLKAARVKTPIPQESLGLARKIRAWMRNWNYVLTYILLITAAQSLNSLFFVPSLHHSHSPAVTKETIFDNIGCDARGAAQLCCIQNSCTCTKIAESSAVFWGPILQWFQKQILKHFHQLSFTVVKQREMPLSSAVWAKHSIRAGCKVLEPCSPPSRPDCWPMS